MLLNLEKIPQLNYLRASRIVMREYPRPVAPNDTHKILLSWARTVDFRAWNYIYQHDKDEIGWGLNRHIPNKWSLPNASGVWLGSTEETQQGSHTTQLGPVA